MTEDKPTDVFPEQEVRLMSGEHVVVKPWNLALGRRMRKRITKMFAAIQAEQKQEVINLESMVDNFEDDIIEIVKDTLGVDQEWMDEKLKYEDLFVLGQAVIEVCIFRGKDQGGFLGKLLGMAGQTALGEGVGLPAPIADRIAKARKEWDASPETTKNGTTGLPKDSPSSPAEDTETQNTSDTP